MSTSITPFSFDGMAVRAVQVDGDTWFVAADVCAILDLGNVTMALKRLDHDEQALISIEGFSRGNDRVNVINESGLYSLTLTSRKPQAKRFKRWVTGEVLPTIRKTGGYGAPVAPVVPQTLAEALRLAADQAERIEEQQKLIAQTAPIVEGFERIARSDGSMCITDAAKTLQVPPRALTKFLLENEWVYRRPMGSGYLAYQARISSGHLEHKVTTGERSDGTEWTSTQVRVTAKGLARLATVVGQDATENVAVSA